jgi:hypothetical protein
MPRFSEFPLPEDILPPRLKRLLSPVTREDPHLLVDVATYFQHDQFGIQRELLHHMMVAVPVAKVAKLGVLREGSTGVVCLGSYRDDKKGLHRNYAPTASGFDPIVMSWGSGLKFAYNLSEKVWTLLGLSPRCLGNDRQSIVYDDLNAPEFDIASGEISNAHYFTADRNITWVMRNDYLRQYLWMRRPLLLL